MSPAEHAKALPPLPKSLISANPHPWGAAYSADQMREYALEAIMRKEQEPISDAEILAQAKESGLSRYVNRHMPGKTSWGGMEENLIACVRALLEKAR